MHLALIAMLGCLDYADLNDMIDDDKKGNNNGGGGKRGDDDDDNDAGGGLGDGDDGAVGDDDDAIGDDDDAVGEDDTCALGVSALCTCSDAYGTPCSNDDMLELYDQCVAGQDQGVLTCMADFVENDTIDCYNAFSVCLAEYQ